MSEDHKILQQTEHRLGVRGERRLSDCELRKHLKVTLFPGEREGDYRAGRAVVSGTKSHAAIRLGCQSH